MFYSNATVALYVRPLFTDLALELRSALQGHFEQPVTIGYCVETVSRFFGFKSQAAHIASGGYDVDRIIDMPSYDDQTLFELANRHGIADPEFVSEMLERLVSEECDPRISLAKRLVRSVRENCEFSEAGYVGSAILKPEDVDACGHSACEPEFVDFLFASSPFLSIQVFSHATVDRSLQGHCAVDPDAALNIAAYLHDSALALLDMRQ